ncbi:hypothetical protein PHMEG_0001728 [Phytophthora megakarya]|uniref:Uncharacterized protein n=1 Tax=Phytophthora megakarya TaxID=4795 RepID=A0A225X237_9STRA|nr:hypothetical protein PHMEG_0001728 [Phytophthora megakarya]
MDMLQRLREIGLRHGRYQSKFRVRYEPKTRRTKRIRRALPWESLFMRKSRSEKREIILKPWEYPMAAQNLSVILIQKRLQYAWKAHYQLKLYQRQAHDTNPRSAVLSPANRSALYIQTTWKSYTHRRIFRYYRDLLTFRNTGDPARMLRAINPSEASLLDASMGAQVRFRLGGLTFPPTIYYKIFTRKPVCDLGTFSPKNYTVARQTAPSSHSHIKSRTTYIRVGNSYYRARQQAEDTRLWYHRLENNGWRPVTAKVLAEADADPIAQATGRRTVENFHYSKIVRQQDRERARRYKKRLWMQKLYSQGLLTAASHPEDEDEEDQPDKPRVLFDVDFEDDNWEVEAEDMFQWASALDYDEYVDNWNELGRTAATNDKLL